jgi:hypothetical protein
LQWVLDAARLARASTAQEPSRAAAACETSDVFAALCIEHVRELNVIGL